MLTKNTSKRTTVLFGGAIVHNKPLPGYSHATPMRFTSIVALKPVCLIDSDIFIDLDIAT